MAMELEFKKEAYRTEVLSKGVHTTCFAKCVTNFSQPDLQTDEAECMDKCVWKYLQVNRVMSSTLQRAMMAPGDLQSGGNRRR
jgi:hypothetical protein